MANIKSAKKRAKQSVTRRARNAGLRTASRTVIKAVKKAAGSGDKAAAMAAMQKMQSVVDRVAAKGVIHKRAAARQKSRLAHAVKALG